MNEYEMFKPTLMGGYDKDDVAEQFRNLKEEHIKRQSQAQKDLADRDAQIADLKNKLDEKTKQKDKLERDISNKYQKYIEHHDSISHLLVDAQIKGEEIVKEAKAKRDQMLKLTDAEIKRKFDGVQAEVDEKIADGERKYKALQGEMDEIMELINQAQKRFMVSYKEIHKIIGGLPKKTQDTDAEDDGDNEEA